jgi:hypothetical protein
MQASSPVYIVYVVAHTPHYLLGTSAAARGDRDGDTPSLLTDCQEVRGSSCAEHGQVLVTDPFVLTFELWQAMSVSFRLRSTTEWSLSACGRWTAGRSYWVKGES